MIKINGKIYGEKNTGLEVTGELSPGRPVVLKKQYNATTQQYAEVETKPTFKNSLVTTRNGVLTVVPLYGPGNLVVGDSNGHLTTNAIVVLPELPPAGRELVAEVIGSTDPSASVNSLQLSLAPNYWYEIEVCGAGGGGGAGGITKNKLLSDEPYGGRGGDGGYIKYLVGYTGKPYQMTIAAGNVGGQALGRTVSTNGTVSGVMSSGDGGRDYDIGGGRTTTENGTGGSVTSTTSFTYGEMLGGKGYGDQNNGTGDGGYAYIEQYNYLNNLSYGTGGGAGAKYGGSGGGGAAPLNGCASGGGGGGGCNGDKAGGNGGTITGSYGLSWNYQTFGYGGGGGGCLGVAYPNVAPYAGAAGGGGGGSCVKGLSSNDVTAIVGGGGGGGGGFNDQQSTGRRTYGSSGGSGGTYVDTSINDSNIQVVSTTRPEGFVYGKGGSAGMYKAADGSTSEVGKPETHTTSGGQATPGIVRIYRCI